jgi:outer membrane protein, heavy metal efflux system
MRIGMRNRARALQSALLGLVSVMDTGLVFAQAPDRVESPAASGAASRVVSGAGDRALQPLTRAAAADAALAHGARAALARADSLVARAAVVSAGQHDNPTAALSYSKDSPNYHALFSYPFDYPWMRDNRVRAAQLGLQSAAYRYAFERGAVEFEVDTSYTQALAAGARSRISHRNALDADSLRRLAVIRRDAGDASDMDVELTTVNGAQQANIATADSLASISALLDLQALLGMPSDEISVTLTDTLEAPPMAAPTPATGTLRPDTTHGTSPAMQASTSSNNVPLPVAAAQAQLQSQKLALMAAKQTAAGAPSIQAGFDYHDPQEPGLLPTVGLSFPLPLFNSNAGEVELAKANIDRAAAELEAARRESAAQLAQATRALDVSLMRVRRDHDMLSLADRVVARSLTAFADGASPVSAVLEAQRSAREARLQYIDDLAAANTAASAVRLFTLTAPTK